MHLLHFCRQVTQTWKQGNQQLWILSMCCHLSGYFALSHSLHRHTSTIITTFCLDNIYCLLIKNVKIKMARQNIVIIPIYHYKKKWLHKHSYLKGMALQETSFKTHSIWKFDNNMNSFWMICWRFIWNMHLVFNLLPLYFLEQWNNIHLPATEYWRQMQKVSVHW